MTPMTTPSQQTLRARIEVRPTSWETTYVDYWGTQVTAFEVLRPHDQLEVTARSVVELDDVAAFPGAADLLGLDVGRLGWADLGSPQVYDEYVEMLLMTPRTDPPDDLVEQVSGWPGRSGPDEVARQVCDLVHQQMSYVPGSSEVRSTAARSVGGGLGGLPGHRPRLHRSPALGRHPRALRLRLLRPADQPAAGRGHDRAEPRLAGVVDRQLDRLRPDQRGPARRPPRRRRPGPRLRRRHPAQGHLLRIGALDPLRRGADPAPGLTAPSPMGRLRRVPLGPYGAGPCRDAA